jgi:transposase-like protein
VTPAAMNIHTCPICCPSCQLDQFRKHGCYTRKGFHSTEYGATVEVSVPRYRCLNPRCKRATFSILPAGVLRLCRFRWDDLLSVRQALAAGTSGRHLARVWRSRPAKCVFSSVRQVNIVRFDRSHSGEATFC